MSMAPTTAPKVLWTASPTFLAIRVPPSSSKAASSNSAAEKHAHMKSGTHTPCYRYHIQRTVQTDITLNMRKDLPVGIPLLWKHASQTRTGARPQPLSGTGRVFEEQESQKPSPQARQWCLVSLAWNSSPHLWHFYNTHTVMLTCLQVYYQLSIQYRILEIMFSLHSEETQCERFSSNPRFVYHVPG